MKAVSKAEVDAANAARAAAAADVNARRDNASAAKAQIAAAGRRATCSRPRSRCCRRSSRTPSSSSATTASWRRCRPHRQAQRRSRRARPAGPAAGRRGAGRRLGHRQLQGNPAGRPRSRARKSRSKIDALPDEHLVGRVDSFSPASGNQFALLPADNATGNFTKIVQRVPVKITLAPEDVKRLRRPPGAGHVGGRRSTCARSAQQPAPRKALGEVRP
jgi:membrane fusion protein (multidrug efflux system)